MQNQQAEFWSHVAEKYDRVVDRQIGAGMRSQVRARLEKEAALGATVEFGCGTGFCTTALARRSRSVIATDISPGMLTVASRLVTASNVTFQKQDVQATSFDDASFDTAFIGLVLHFADPVRSLAEVRRVLADGGTLLIANLDPGALTGFARLRSRIRVIYQGVVGYRTKPPKHFGSNVLSQGELCALLRAAGFDVLEVEAIKPASQGSHVPVEYVRAVKRPVF